MDRRLLELDIEDLVEGERACASGGGRLYAERAYLVRGAVRLAGHGSSPKVIDRCSWNAAIGDGKRKATQRAGSSVDDVLFLFWSGFLWLPSHIPVRTAREQARCRVPCGVRPRYPPLHLHIFGNYLDLYAADLAFREGMRRMSMKALTGMFGILALRHPHSNLVRGYWQRHQLGRETEMLGLARDLQREAMARERARPG